MQSVRCFVVSAMSVLGLFALFSCQKRKEETHSLSEGERLVQESIQAHGGSEKWYGNGLLSFRWAYHMTDRGPEAVVDTSQVVDPTTMAVVHEVPGQVLRFGMNEGQAWIHPKGAQFSPPPRFWALTPFYFIGIPFVFNDEKANFEKLLERKTFEGTDYDQVKVTYDQGAGDTPDDYYVLLIDPESKLTRAAYYIVTSSLVGNGGPPVEKLITLDGLTEVDGVMLSSGHRTFMMNGGKIAEKQMRFTEVSELEFVPRGAVDLSIPEGAEKL